MAKMNYCYGLKIGLLVIFAIVGVWYSMAIPPGEGVDETLHLDYVRYIKEQHTLPVQPMSRDQGVQVWMGHHPPLYYALGAIGTLGIDTLDFAQVFQPNPHFVWRENDGQNGWNVMLHFGQDQLPNHGSVLALYVLRWMSVVIGIITLYAIYHATEQLLPNQPWATIGATAIIGFNPSFLFMSSTVHHDILLAAIYALAMWWMLWFWNKPGKWPSVAVGGLLLSGAVLTKASGLSLVPVMAWLFVIRAVYNKDWRGEARHAMLTFGIVAVTSGWWFIRNQILYGDLLGRRMFLGIYTHMARSEQYTWHILTDEFIAQLQRTYWGSFGYMHITFPEISEPFWWLTGIACLGLLIALIRNHSVIAASWFKWSIPIANLLTLFAFLTLLSIQHRGSGQGRYLFPAGFSIGALLIAGLNGFFNWRYQRLISTLVAIGMLTCAVWLPMNFVLPKYASPSKVSREEMLRVQTSDIQLVKGVELVGYYIDSGRVFPGQWVPVSLYWKAVGEPAGRQDPKIRLEMIDGDGKVISSDTLWPVPSMPPSVWQANAIYVTHAVLGLPVSSHNIVDSKVS